MAYENYVRLDTGYTRPAEVDALIDAPLKAQRSLGWKAKPTGVQWPSSWSPPTV